MSNDKNRVLDSNGKEIEVGKRYIYTTTRGSMCDIDIEERDGVLWGTGPFTEFTLSVWLGAYDFESIVLSEEQPIGKNRVLEEFDTVDHVIVMHGGESVKVEIDYMDYNSLMRIWAKFRELRFEGTSIEHCRYTREHAVYCAKIRLAMTDGTLPDFYNALVKAVEWYNSTVKK